MTSLLLVTDGDGARGFWTMTIVWWFRAVDCGWWLLDLPLSGFIPAITNGSMVVVFGLPTLGLPFLPLLEPFLSTTNTTSPSSDLADDPDGSPVSWDPDFWGRTWFAVSNAGESESVIWLADCSIQAPLLGELAGEAAWARDAADATVFLYMLVRALFMVLLSWGSNAQRRCQKYIYNGPAQRRCQKYIYNCPRMILRSPMQSETHGVKLRVVLW